MRMRGPFSTLGMTFLGLESNLQCIGVYPTVRRISEQCGTRTPGRGVFMAATMIITCPKCKKQLKGSEAFIGKSVRCKSCEHKFVVQAAGSPKPPPAAGPTKNTAPVEQAVYDFAPGSGSKEKSGYSKTGPKSDSLNAPIKIAAGLPRSKPR